MNRNQIWRAVAYSTDTCKEHDELHVFVDAPDYETAKSRIYERLSEEWEIEQPSIWDDKPACIEFHNLWGRRSCVIWLWGRKYHQACRCWRVVGMAESQSMIQNP